MKNLKALRKAKGYTQLQLAQFLQVGAATVARWENHGSSVYLGQILRLCDVLKCSPAQLFDAENCDNNTISIPVFCADSGKILYCEKFSADSAAALCSFGVVVPYNLSPRFCAGDVAYFAFDSTPHAEDLVMSVDNNYNGQMHIFKGYDENLAVIAVCKILHQKI